MSTAGAAVDVAAVVAVAPATAMLLLLGVAVGTFVKLCVTQSAPAASSRAARK